MNLESLSRLRMLGAVLWLSCLCLWSAGSIEGQTRKEVVAQAGDILRGEVLQLGADVVLRLYGPQGDVLQEVDRWTGDVGPELILWHVQVPGTYVLEVPGTSQEVPGTSQEVPGTSQEVPGTSQEVPGTLGWKMQELFARPAVDAVERQVALAYADFLAAASGGESASLQEISLRLGRLGAEELSLEAHYEWVSLLGGVASWAEAADGFSEVAERARQIDASIWEVLARDALVQASMDRGEAQEALRHSDRVLELCDDLQVSGWPMRRWQAISHMRRQRAFSFLGRLEDAVEAGELAASLLRQPQESHWLYEVLHQRGVLLRRSFEDGRRAVADLQAALDHVPEDEAWDAARANTLDQLGAAYELLRDVDAARGAYQQAIDLDRGRRPCAEANHRARLALLEQRQGRQRQERAERQSQLRGDAPDRGLLKAARLLLDQAAAQAATSRRLLMEVEVATIGEGKGCGRDGQAARLRLAEVARLAGQPAQAAIWHRQRLDLAVRQEDPLAALESHLGLAQAALDGAEGAEGAEAVSHLRRADALYQELRSGVQREELRLGLDRAARQRMDLHLALLTEGKVYDGPWAGPHLEALSLTERETERVLRESMDGGRAFTKMTSSTDWEAVRQRLGPADGLLYLRLGEPNSHGWWLNSERLGYRPLPSRQVLEPWIEDLRRGLADPRSHVAPGLTWTSARLLGPWGTELGQLVDTSSPRLIVVADGVLSALPWAALPLDGGGEPLVESMTVVSLPSAAWLSRPSSAIPRGAGWVLADPLYDDWAALAASAGEADAVARLARQHGRPVELWTGAEASKQRLLSAEVEEAAWLHVAAHATAPTPRGGDASLWLAQRDDMGRPVEGRLQARQLQQLSLRADWVVLSACATGVDGWDATAPEGHGLSKGFLRAGARQVVSSLWPISDAVTADLMSRFYLELLAEERPGTAPGKAVSVADALRETQRALRRRDATAHPFYWAAFVVHGVKDPDR